MPDIQPDYSFPAFAALQQIVSWVLGVAMLLSFLALIVVILGVAFKGFGNQRFQQFSAGNVGWVLLGVICLGSLNGLWAFFAGFDLGF